MWVDEDFLKTFYVDTDANLWLWIRAYTCEPGHVPIADNIGEIRQSDQHLCCLRLRYYNTCSCCV